MGDGVNDNAADDRPQSRRKGPIARGIGWLLALCGILFVAQVFVGFVGLPGWLLFWMTGGEPPVDHPRYVVVLGGGGIPSETGLMRTYCAAAYGAGRTGVTFIVALPADGDPTTNSVGRMRRELVMRGIPAESVIMEYRGRSTWEQAANIRRMLDSGTDQHMAIVTSPYHVRRALLCFRKQGFRNVTGLPAVGVGAEADLGGGTTLRYAFWSNLVSEIEVLRELCALAQYGWKGWI